jgi:hypothetical protein
LLQLIAAVRCSSSLQQLVAAARCSSSLQQLIAAAHCCSSLQQFVAMVPDLDQNSWISVDRWQSVTIRKTMFYDFE